MGERAFIVFISVVLFVPSSVTAETQTQKYTPLHHFQLPCGNCHMPGSTDTSSLFQESNVGWQVNGDINQQCTTPGCHDFDPMLSHPVGIRSEVIAPVDMPLDSEERLTCLTCHDKQGSSDDLIVPDSGFERSLRTPRGVEFCISCHMKMGGTTVTQSHWQFSARAHLISEKYPFKETANFEQFFGDIDPESRTCLSCHDNISVTIPAQNETTGQKKRRWQKMTDHPIGMEYGDVALRRVGSYKFPLIGDCIRMFNGRVGCGSCHSLYAQTKDHLVERNERGVLCRKCHNK